MLRTRTEFRIVVAALALAGCAAASAGEPKTVCTITVNSPDEKEAFRRRLPPGQYRFVELVEKGRADWLRSSCAQATRCDVLIVSGHFNAGDTFYSDDIAKDEHLAIDELERASCSDSCPALFSRLKEVYLFGCESLNPDASKYSSSQGDSGLARMRRIFAGVPVIYGFSAAAPRGPAAAALIDRHFDAGASLFGSGRTSASFLAAFSRSGMAATAGVRANDAGAERERVCRFFDERLSPARKVALVHQALRRDMTEALGSFERIDRLLVTLAAAEGGSPAFLLALAEISVDDATRERYLAAVHATREAPRRVRMIALAGTFGWLSPEAGRAELVRLLDEILAGRSIGFAEVELACGLNDRGELAGALARVSARASGMRVGESAVLACLGDAEARKRILLALASGNERDAQTAQAYLRHRPVSDAAELRAMAHAIGGMTQPGAQIRALDTLGRLRIVDPEILDGLRLSFASATTLGLQRAIAEIFVRSGTGAAAQPGLAAVLRGHRMKSSSGDDIIDTLIRRLQVS